MPLAASFVHNRSGDLSLVRKLLGCDVQFDADADEINFNSAVMDLPAVGYDPFLHELMLRNCEEAIRVRPSNVSAFRTVVENAIGPLLPHAEAQAKTVAGRLGVSERTFARRLASEGLTFGEILDGLRRDLAVRHLEEPSLQISRIAWMLGFQQPSAFSHACRRWTGRARQNIGIVTRLTWSSSSQFTGNQGRSTLAPEGAKLAKSALASAHLRPRCGSRRRRQARRSRR